MSLTVSLLVSNVIFLGLLLFFRNRWTSPENFTQPQNQKLQALSQELDRTIAERDKLELIAKDKDAKYLALFEGATDGIILISLEFGQIVDCNHSICEYLGYSREEFLTLKLSELEEDSEDDLNQRFSRIRATGQEQFKTPLKTKSGELKHANVTGNAIQFGNQLFAQYIVQLSKQSIEFPLDSISEQLWPKTGDDFFCTFAEHLFDLYWTEFVIVGQRGNTRSTANTIESIYAFHNGQKVENFQYDLVHSPCKQALKNGMFLSTSGTRDKFPNFPMLGKFRIESYIGIALNQPTDPMSGIFCVLSSKPLENPGPLVSYLKIFSSKASAELERRHSEKKLLQYQQILDNASDLLSFVGLDSKVQVVNKYCLEAFGIRPEEITGDSLKLMYGDHNYDTVIENSLMRCLNGEKAVTRVEKIVPKFGLRQFENKMNPVSDSNGKVTGVVINARDVTDLVKAEQEQKFRANLLESLTQHEHYTDILNQIIYWVESFDPACLCSILLLDRDGKRLVPGAAPSLPKFYSDAFNGLEIGEGVGCCGTAAYTGERVIVEDIHSHPFWTKYKTLTDRVNMKSCWSQPIRSSTGSVMGTFAIYYLEPKKPRQNDLHMIESVAFIASIAIERHITEIERDRLESQLRQAQKMEAIGQLTGGIAHDFNNILGSILGFTGLALNRCLDGNPEKLEAYLKEIQSAGERARDLIKQMLAFSRSGLKKPERLKINAEINKAFSLLRPLIPANIAIETALSRDDLNIHSAPNQLEQIILNLCINARDSIAHYGKIKFVTERFSARNAICSSCYASFSGIYAELTITDSGSGIAQSVLDRIFEPFFTTKEIGQGSGMGLPMVHGIVHEYEGHIIIESKPEEGTKVRIFFPLLEETTASATHTH